MSETNSMPESTAAPKPATWPAKVVSVLSESRVAINRGVTHGVKAGHRFLVYGLSEKELTDPETGENLGRLEIVRGTGVALHVQARLTTIECDRRAEPERRIIKRSPLWHIAMNQEEERIEEPREKLPFDDAEVGDLVRPI